MMGSPNKLATAANQLLDNVLLLLLLPVAKQQEVRMLSDEWLAQFHSTKPSLMGILDWIKCSAAITSFLVQPSIPKTSQPSIRPYDGQPRQTGYCCK
jgi:hypothetical protein